MQGSPREPLRQIAVAGDGITALAAAIALRRALPQCTVTLIPTPPEPAALADHSASLTPHSNAFHKQIGISEMTLAARVGASPRLGAELIGWAGEHSRAIHSFGSASPDGLDIASVPAALAEAGRFAHPSDDPTSPLADIDYALRVSPAAYRRHLSALAAHLGVARLTSRFAAALPDGEGGIARIKVSDGQDIEADLFIDCSGPAALLASALPPSARADWSHILPCDRLLVPAAPLPPRLTPLDRITATPLGWCSQVHGRDGTHVLFAANSSVGTPEEWAGMAGFNPEALIAIAPGRRALVWQANVVSIGDAAAQFEPLHGLAPGLALAQIGLLLELLPGRDLHPLERAEFNRRAGAMADRVRDFIALHYCGSKRPDGAFWSYAAQLDRPESLQLTFDEFARRGRLPFFEEEIMPRDAWIMAMAAIGNTQGQTPVSLARSPTASAQLNAIHKARSQAALEAARPYPEWLAAYLEDAR